MSYTRNLHSLICLGLVSLFAINASAEMTNPVKEDKDGRSYVFVLIGDLHRQLVGYYVKRLNEQLVPPLTKEQEEAIRTLLNHEADELERIQMGNYNDLAYAIRKTVELADQSHKRLYSILNADQHYIIPNIIETRKDRLKDRVNIWLDSVWYSVEHPDMEE